MREPLETQLEKHNLRHWIPAIKEVLRLLNGSEKWLDDDRDNPQEQIATGLDRIALLAGHARDGAMCELLSQLLVWNVAVKKRRLFWNPLEIAFKDFVQDSEMTSGWMHYKRNCSEADVYKWLIARVEQLTDAYRR